MFHFMLQAENILSGAPERPKDSIICPLRGDSIGVDCQQRGANAFGKASTLANNAIQGSGHSDRLWPIVENDVQQLDRDEQEHAQIHQ